MALSNDASRFLHVVHDDCIADGSALLIEVEAKLNINRSQSTSITKELVDLGYIRLSGVGAYTITKAGTGALVSPDGTPSVKFRQDGTPLIKSRPDGVPGSGFHPDGTPRNKS